MAAGGLEVDEHGHLVTDDTYRTSVEGVWAFGDTANHFQLKHMANAEARIVTHILTHPDDLRQLVPTVVPHAVFSDPQIAGMGTSSFVKIIVDPHTRLLLGAHIIGPQAATLLQPLLQARTLGQTVDSLAHDVLYVHPALTEVVEQTLLAL